MREAGAGRRSADGRGQGIGPLAVVVTVTWSSRGEAVVESVRVARYWMKRAGGLAIAPPLAGTAAQADQVAPSVEVRVSSSRTVPVGAWPAQLSRVQRPDAP